MGALTLHPHQQGADEAQLAAVLAGRSEPIRELYLAVHRLVLAELPDDLQHATDLTDGTTGYGARQYGYDGWGMVALAAHAKWVSLHLMRGASLPDPAGLLEGSGKAMRHVKLRSLAQLEDRAPALRALLWASLEAGKTG